MGAGRHGTACVGVSYVHNSLSARRSIVCCLRHAAIGCMCHAVAHSGLCKLARTVLKGGLRPAVAEDPSLRQGCFAHGMCRACFEEYLVNSGGTVDGCDPPAFTSGVQKTLLLEAQKVRVLLLLLLLCRDALATIDLGCCCPLGHRPVMYRSWVVPEPWDRAARRLPSQPPTQCSLPSLTSI